MNPRNQQDSMRRYLDGELSDREASAFLDTLAANAELEAELREHERIDAVASGLRAELPREGFADRVMFRLRSHGPVRGPSKAPRARGRLAWAIAASIVIGIGIGRAPVDGLWPATAEHSSQPSVSVSPLAFHPDAPGGRPMRVVRITYVPASSETRSVSVAGSFNGWNPELVPMSQEGQVWSAVLVLPVGAYEYMFFEDGERWVTDPLAPRTREDGFGGRNAVLDIGV